MQKNEPVPIDYDQFRQCHFCALVLPIYELKKESRIKDAIETTSNPFEEKNAIMPINDPKTPTNRAIEDFKKELDSIQDEDEKADKRKVGLVKFVSYAIDDY